MKAVYIMTLLLLNTNVVDATPLRVLQEKGCTQVYRQLARRYIRDNRELFRIYDDALPKPFNLRAMQVCHSRDLDRGSLEIKREVTFCDRHNRLTLFTMGDDYCQNERVLGIKQVRAKD